MAQGSLTFADSDAGDEFSNNLFSDLAPILALFGEKVAMQFMSESMGWADSIIFSMAPIGVLTAVVGAIRVGGARWLRALVGRAKENIAVAESELMSSTSNEVCEVFNGRHVVRLMGKPSIKELIFMEYGGVATEGNEDVTKVNRFRFFTLSEALEEKHLIRKDFPGYPTLRQGKTKTASCFGKNMNCISNDDLELGRRTPTPTRETKRTRNLEWPLKIYDKVRGRINDISECLWPSDIAVKREEIEAARLQALSREPPNISLNVHLRGGRSELYFVAALGVILQMGVLVFDWFITYHPGFRQRKGGRDVRSYAFPLTLVGTLVLIVGLLICSYIIESAAVAEIHRSNGRGDLQMLWIQQGGSVSDQIFDSYLILARKKSDHVITSRRRRGNRGSRRFFITTVFTTIGAAVTIAGFVLQFVGLRSMTWYASISQLTATIIMIILRAYVRRGLSTSPWARLIPKGHEIDWLATRISNDEDRGRLLGGNRGKGQSPRKRRSWRSIFQGTPGENRPSDCPWNDDNEDGFWDKESFKWKVQTVGDFGTRYQSLMIRDSREELSGRGSMSMRYIQARMDLRSNTGWSGPAIEQAVRVASAIETFMNAFFPKDLDVERLVWSISNGPMISEVPADNVRFDLSRKDSVWKADVGQIEAFLSLWLFSVSQKESQTAGNKIKRGIAGNLSGTASSNHSLRLLAPNHKSILQCMNWWLGSAVALVREAEIKDLQTEGKDAFDIDLNISRESTYDTANNNREKFSPTQNSSATSKSNYMVQSIRFERHRIVGYQAVEPEDAKVLVAMSDATLDLLYAQELFSAFIRSFVQFDYKTMTSPIKGSTKSMPPVQEMDENGTLLVESVALEHKELDRVVKAISRSGLGSDEDIMLSILPPLIMKHMLPDMTAVVHSIRDRGRIQESYNRWEEAGELYMEGFMAFQPPYMDRQKAAIEQATCALTEFIRELTLEIDITEQFREQKYHREKEKKFNRTQELTDLRDKINDALIKNGDRSVLKKITQINGWQKREEGVQVWSAQQEPMSPGFAGPEGYQDSPGFWTTLHGIVARDLVTHFKKVFQKKTGGMAGTGPPDPRDFAGLTPLHYVKSVDIAKLLLEAGTSITAKGHDGLTPLHNAARAGNEDIVVLLMGYGCDLNLRDNHRRTPLHWAAYGGHSKVVRVLLKNGADPLVVSEHSRSPLHMAAGGGHLEVVRVLVKSGRVEINASDSDGRTALHLAVAGNHTELISHLSPLSSLGGSWPEDRSGFTAIHLGAFLGNTEAVKAALGAGQYTESEGGVRLSFPASATLGTVLHAAAQSGKTEVIEYILTLEDAPSIDAKDSAGGTPLMCAASHGQNDVVKLLLRSGSKVDAVNRSGRSALHLVVMEEGSGHLDVIKTLLAAGPNSNLQDEDGFTPLLRAVDIGNISAVEILIPGSNIDAVDHDKRTALHLAVTDISTSISRPLIELLVSSGANINVKDNTGKTPTQYPVVRRLGWLRDYFAEKGGKVFDTDVGRITSTGPLKRGRYERELTDDECSDEERFYRTRAQC